MTAGMFAIALDQLRYQKARTALVIASIAFAFFLFGTLGALRHSLDAGGGSLADRRLIVTHKLGMMQTMPVAMRERLLEIKGVEDVGYATWMGTYYREPTAGILTLAVDPKTWLDQHPEMRMSDSARRAFLETKDGLLVAESAAKKHGWEVGETVPLGSIMFPPPRGQPAWRFKVVGTFTLNGGGAGEYSLAQYGYFNDNRFVWPDTVGTWIVTPREDEDAAELAQRIDTALADSPTPTATTTDRQFQSEFTQQFGDISTVIKWVVGLAFVSLIVIVTSGMALSTRQRSKDIGVLRTLGFSRLQVYQTILGQSLILFAIGAGLGVGAAAIVNQQVTTAMADVFPSFIMPLQVALGGAGLAVGLALLTGAVPAWIALSVRPLEAFALEQA